MSIAIMTEVWKDAPVSGTELLLLLALADSANDDRECWPSLRHLQHKVRVSRPQIQKLITKLTDAGLIEKVLKGGKGARGRESNLYRILSMTGITGDTSEVSQEIPVDAGTGITGDTLIRHSDPPVNLSAGADDPASEPQPDAVKPKAARPPNPMYDAIKDVWGYTAARNGQMAAVLYGTSTKKGYAEYNLEQPVTPDELRQWAAWYRRTALGGDEKMSMVEELIKVQSSITRWQELTADGSTDTEDVKYFADTEEFIGGKPW